MPLRTAAAILVCLVIGLAQAPHTPASESLSGQDGVNISRLKRTIAESYTLAESWFLGSLQPDNTFVYMYDPVRRQYAQTNNAIRQLMAARLLGELATHDPSLLSAHKNNLSHIFTHWYKEEGGIAHIHFNDKASLGASGIALRVLAASPYVAQGDGEKRYHRKAMRLVRGIQELMAPDGSFKAFFVEPPEEDMMDEEYLLSYYSGEAILGLVEHYQRFKDSLALELAIKAQDYYLDHYVTHMAENYRPFYVPWHTMSLSALYAITLDPRYPQAIFALNDELLKIQDREKYPGRFAATEGSRYTKAHSASDGVYTESLAYALDMARKMGDKEREARYLKAIDLAVANLVSLQYTNQHSTLFVGDPRVTGAVRIRSKTFTIRIDCVQHTLDAYRKLLEILQQTI
ncbi:MAG: glycoside hydrolase family 127 protein [Desulfatibacillum sp.]|nr:glycoside hydrolase family 127 protein [Desulfatibacillum sp.]